MDGLYHSYRESMIKTRRFSSLKEVKSKSRTQDGNRFVDHSYRKMWSVGIKFQRNSVDILQVCVMHLCHHGWIHSFSYLDIEFVYIGPQQCRRMQYFVINHD